MTNRNILVDIDNTLTTIDYTLERLGEFSGAGWKSPEEIYTFNLNEVYGLDKKQTANFWKETEADIVRYSALNESVYTYIQEKLRPNDTVSIITARGPEHYEGTLEWLAKHGIKYDEMLCIGKQQNKLEWSIQNKRRFDVVVEDNPAYLEILPKDVRKIVVDYPYNRHINADARL